MDQEKERRSRLQKLRPRQLDVLRLRCQGRSLKEIAEALVIVEATVDYHMRRIYRTLQIDGLPERSRPVELGRYCDLLSRLDDAPMPVAPVADEDSTDPNPSDPDPSDSDHDLIPSREDEEGWHRAGLAVLEDERRLTGARQPGAVRPDIVIRHEPIMPPPLPHRIPRSLAIAIIVGIALIAGLTGALVVLLLRPTPQPQVVVVTPTPGGGPAADGSRPAASTSAPPTGASAPATVVAQLAPPTPPPPPPTQIPTQPPATAIPPTPIPPTAIPPTPVPPTPVPPPTATRQPPSPTPRPQPGAVLYEANWSGNLAGWSGGSEWRAVNGMLVNNGSASWTPSVALAPFRAAGDDYVAEAEIQQLEGHGFGVIVRVDEGQTVALGNGYNAGYVTLDGACIYLGAPGWSLPLGKRDFTAGTGWHVYRVEVKGNVLRLLIDGGLMVERTDNRFLTGPSVGIWSVAAQINVRKFRVIAQ